MSLISAGVNLRRQGLLGLTEAARLETHREIAEKNLESAKEAAEMQTLGTGAGIGGAIGVNKALAAKKAAGAAAGSAKGGGLLATPGGVESVLGLGSAPSATAQVGQVAEMTKALSDTTQAVNTINAGGSVAAGGGTAGAGGAAAGSSGVMATLSTIAAPIAIGIGAAFLLNKLLG